LHRRKELDLVAVVTDSAANVPPELASELGITVVPLHLRFGDDSYRDGIEMDGAEFYARLRRGDPATTAAPSVGDWLAGFETTGADEVVCVTLASGLSATHHEAQLAAERFPGRAEVVDSQSASMGEGFAAVAAARAAREGASQADAEAAAREVVSKAVLVGAIETFEYLRRSGRVGKLQAYAATRLAIRPVFRLIAGEIEPIGRPRTRSRAVAMVVEKTLKAAGDGRPLHVAAFHADAEDDAVAMIERIRSETEVAESFVVESTPAIGANTGPGLVGLAAYRD